jgi:hypothetical protein
MMPEQHRFNADGTLRRGRPRTSEKVYRVSLSGNCALCYERAAKPESSIVDLKANSDRAGRVVPRSRQGKITRLAPMRCRKRANAAISARRGRAYARRHSHLSNSL